MRGLLLRADDVLRHRGGDLSAEGLSGRLALIIVFGMFYGAVMGSFGGLSGDRPWQILYSALKVPLMLLVTFAISLPSFFVLNTLLGLRDDFRAALAAVISTQAGMAIVLAALAPLTVTWYASHGGYSAALVFNGLMFLVASASAQFVLRGYYRPLIAGSRKHRWLAGAWLVLYSFVAIQMAWVLRPFVGAPTAPV